MKLAAILRLAEALDREHADRVKNLHIDKSRHNFKLNLEGEGDLLLEKWAVSRGCELFEKMFKKKVQVQ